MALIELKEYLKKNITIPKLDFINNPLTKMPYHKEWSRTAKNISDFNDYVKFYYDKTWSTLCRYYQGPNIINKQIYLDHELNLVLAGSEPIPADPISTKFQYYGNDLMIMFLTSAPFKSIHTNLLCCIIYQSKEYFFDLCTIKKSFENQIIDLELRTDDKSRAQFSIFLSKNRQSNLVYIDFNSNIMPFFPGDFITNKSALIHDQSQEIRVDMYQILDKIVSKKFSPIQIYHRIHRAKFVDVDFLFN